MKRAAAVLLIGSAALMLQGAVNAFVPVHLTPDLRFLLVVAVGLHWRSAAAGAVVAALLGFVADLLSGSLLGEQALLSKRLAELSRRAPVDVEGVVDIAALTFDGPDLDRVDAICDRLGFERLRERVRRAL